MPNKVEPTFDRATAIIQSSLALDEIHQALDDGAHELETYNGHSLCVPNCGLCCTRMTPMVMGVEVANIVSYLGGEDKFREKVERSLNWVSEDHSHLPGVSLAEDVGILASGRCPFLDPNLECSIYEVRPLTCRGYGVTLPADEWCPRPLHFSESSRTRNIIGADTVLGRTINAMIFSLKFIVSKAAPDLTTFGFLPTMIAKAMARDEFTSLLEGGKINKVKLTEFNSSPGLFVDPDRINVIQVEKRIADDERQLTSDPNRKRRNSRLHGEYPKFRFPGTA